MAGYNKGILVDRLDNKIHVNGPTILLVFIFLNFMFPTFPDFTRGGLYFGILLILGILVLLILVLSQLNRLATSERVYHSSLGFFLGFLGLTVASLVIDYERVIFADFVELTKPFLAFLLFIGFYATLHSVKDCRKVVKGYSVIFVIVALIGIFEALFGLHHITHILYTRPRGILMGKAVSPFGITYMYATFMLLASAFFFSRFLAVNRKAFRYLLLFSLCSLALVLTQSRTVFLAFITMALFFIVVYPFYKMPGRKRILLVFTPVITLLVLIVVAYFDVISSNFSYLYVGLEHLFRQGVDPEGDGSANIRISQIVWAYENREMYGIIGSGIGKGYYRLLESFYALYIYRYGLVGILMYVVIASIFLVRSFQAAKIAFRKQDTLLFSFFIALHIFVLLLPITSLASVITDQFIFLILYYGSLGLTLRYVSLERSKPIL